MHDGSQSNFNARFSLEMVGFDVEDENGDGIYEPGEFVYIRRIRVRNSGELASYGPVDELKAPQVECHRPHAGFRSP